MRFIHWLAVILLGSDSRSDAIISPYSIHSVTPQTMQFFKASIPNQSEILPDLDHANSDDYQDGPDYGDYDRMLIHLVL